MKLPLWRRRQDADLDDEIAAHFRMAVADRIKRGQSREEAERAARMEFGNVVRVKEDVRDVWGRRAVDEAGRDIRYACRTLRKSPAFAAAAVLTLALGIGAVTLVFSIVNGVLLRPLPIPDPERVVVVGRVVGADRTVLRGHPYPDYRDLQERNATFDGLAGSFPFAVAFDTGADISREVPNIVTGNYFDVLGVRPFLGRVLSPEDDRDGAAPAIVLSFDFWSAAYHANPAILGTTVRLTAGRSAGGIPDKSYTIVGIAPKGFYGTEVSGRPPAWMPLHALMPEGRLAARQQPGPSLFVFGRLKQGISREAAQSNLAPIINDLAREYAATDAGYQVRITDIRSRMDTSGIRAFASAMLFLAGLDLLTACVSMATGLTARTMDRHREIGIRISLGAGRFRVMRLMLIEALVIASVSGTIAFGMVWWATRVLSQLSVPIDPPMQVDVHPDARVFLVAVVVSILASAVATVAPGRVIATLDPNHALKGLAGSVSGRRWATRDLLTVAQVVFSCVLMAACLLSIVGRRRALTMPLGFDADRVATATLDFDVARYTQEQQRSFMERAAHEVRRIPGVESVAYVGGLPLGLLRV